MTLASLRVTHDPGAFRLHPAMQVARKSEDPVPLTTRTPRGLDPITGSNQPSLRSVDGFGSSSLRSFVGSGSLRLRPAEQISAAGETSEDSGRTRGFADLLPSNEIAARWNQLRRESVQSLWRPIEYAGLGEGSPAASRSGATYSPVA